MKTIRLSAPARRTCLAAAILSTACPDTGFAGSYWEGEHALGEWGGLRQRLEDRGLTVSGSYEADTAGNVSGGRDQGWGYADNIGLAFSFDLEKIMGWHGATFRIEGLDRNGSNISEEYVHNFYTIQQVFGGETVFLYGLNLETKFWDDKAALKIGRFSMNESFASSPLYWVYMNNGFDGSPKALFGSGAVTAYPGSSWAARLDVHPTSETHIQLGVFQVSDRTYDPSKHGVDFSICDDDGVTVITQWQWDPTFFKQAGAGGYPGHYWVGAYISSWTFEKWDGSGHRNVDYGFYFHGDQMVYQESPGSDQGLVVWASYVLQPHRDVQLISNEWSLGFVYKGLIPGRDDDKLFFGAIRGEATDDYARSALKRGAGWPTFESVLELGYQVQVNKFAYVSPEVQYVIRPGGTGRTDDAFVLGLRLGLTF